MNVEPLLQTYKQAFDAFDAQGIANHYMLPCAIFDADGSLTYSAEEELLNKFHSNCEKMRLIQYSGSDYNVLDTCVMGEDAISVHVGWRVRMNGSNHEFRCLYVFRNVFGQWKIFSAHVYEGSFA